MDTDGTQIFVEALVPSASAADTAASTPLQRFNVRAAASILPPHVARQNVELIAIFRYGAPGDRNAAFRQNLDDLVIAQRRAAILVLHEIENRSFHADGAQRFTGRA